MNFKIRKIMKTKILFLGLLLSLLSINCSKDKIEEATISADEISANAKLDNATDDVLKIVETQLGTSDGIAGKSAIGTQGVMGDLPSCATVTRVPEFGTMPAVGEQITKTITFDPAGCTMPNGNVLKGKIIITFVFDPSATSHTINYQFVDFYHNAIKLVGNKSFTRSKTTATATSLPHPIITMNMDMTATFANGNVVTRVGTRTHEMVEGFLTPLNTEDNVFHITGNWTTSFQNGNMRNATISTVLVKKGNCNFVGQGVITFTNSSNTATLDFGDGTCDNQAVFTKDGVSVNITLGN